MRQAKSAAVLLGSSLTSLRLARSTRYGGLIIIDLSSFKSVEISHLWCRTRGNGGDDGSII